MKICWKTIFKSGSIANCFTVLRTYQVRILDLDQKRLAYGLREATAFNASVVLMQLLLFDQCLGSVQHGENLTFFFPISLFQKKCCHSEGVNQNSKSYQIYTQASNWKNKKCNTVTKHYNRVIRCHGKTGVFLISRLYSSTK